MNLPFGNALAAVPPVPGTQGLTPPRVALASLLLVLTSWLTYAVSIATADGLNLAGGGPPIGGDYVAFWGAAEAVLAGHGQVIYDPAFFENWLMTTAMERERFGLTWQYPPTYYFFVLPLALLPFLPGFFLWSGGTALVYCATVQHLFKLQRFGVIALIAAPVTFTAFITGQNGFLTASLLFLAAMLPDRRPLVAGIAAGLLTIKPQLGILLPVAYIAGGHWRAFVTAAFTALVLAGASLIVFGPETWQAFFDSILRVGDGVQNAQYPIHKMPTVFAALAGLGVPGSVAMTVQALTAIATIIGVFIFWRQVKALDLRAAVLCAAVFLCTPYAYYYEMTILILPVLVVIRRAAAESWLAREELILAALWLAAMLLPGMTDFFGAQLGLAMVLAVLGLVLRRSGYVPAFFSSRAMASDRLKTS